MGDDFGIVLIGQGFDYQGFTLFGPVQEKSVQRVGLAGVAYVPGREGFSDHFGITFLDLGGSFSENGPGSCSVHGFTVDLHPLGQLFQESGRWLVQSAVRL